MFTTKLAASSAQPILLISDLHLAPQSPATIALAVRYFEQARNAKALFILGDFFEYWLGDDALDPVMQPIVDALQTLSRSGTRIFLMHGNRDFLLGEDFAHLIKATLIREDEALITMNTLPVLLLHGDTLCTDDHGYQKLRALLRSADWQQSFLSKSIEDRIDMAAQLREQSQEATADKTTDIMDVNDQSVDEAFKRADTHLMIHGHTHRPFDHAGEQRRVVLGDWHEDHAMVARFDGNDLTLERFSG